MDSVDGTPLFIENDPSFCVDITSTKDGKFITVNSNSRTSSEEGTCLCHRLRAFLCSGDLRSNLPLDLKATVRWVLVKDVV
ncbi:hypothetical protein Leryth_008048 [Lithospermum erythrorhizon]|nr:hypothetical protein Leryth_008048 [Lithospermum erythrorhizon]